MSQNADAQNRTAQAQMEPSDANRLVNLLLAAGAALYLIVLVTCLAVLGIDTKGGDRTLTILLVPLAFGGMILLLMQGAVFVGILTGTPWVSLAYGLSLIKRDWKGIAGVILLLTALCAIFAVATT